MGQWVKIYQISKCVSFLLESYACSLDMRPPYLIHLSIYPSTYLPMDLPRVYLRVCV